MSVPVTLITGFLGAGKTTLIRSLLDGGDRRIAVIENELADVAIDQRALGDAAAVVEIAGGCLCCSAREGLGPALDALLRLDCPVEHILIEVSGVAAPGPVAEELISRSASGEIRLRRVVCIIDAAAGGHDRAEIRAQLGSADVVVVSKTDLVPPRVLLRLRAWLATANPFANVLTSTEAVDRPERVLGSADDRTESAFEPDPVATFEVGHGIEAVVLRPEACAAGAAPGWLGEIVARPGILRVKGVVTTDAGPLGVQGVGGTMILEWLAASPDDAALVVIGQDLDRRAIAAWAGKPGTV